VRLNLLCLALGGLLGANLVLFVSSTRQLLDARSERVLVEKISGEVRVFCAERR
jgi:hypothetical protein